MAGGLRAKAASQSRNWRDAGEGNAKGRQKRCEVNMADIEKAIREDRWATTAHARKRAGQRKIECTASMLWRRVKYYRTIPVMREGQAPLFWDIPRTDCRFTPSALLTLRERYR